MLTFALLLVSIASLAAASPISPQPRGQLCNGDASLCDRIYSNISFVGTHDSAFVGSTDDPRVNQELSVTDQLNAGVRFLQAQTHKNVLGELSMCHTSCWLLDAGPLTDYLGEIKSWLDSNANDVVTLLLTNGDFIDVSMFGDAMTSVGLNSLTFVPSTSPNTLDKDAWPTLQNLINQNKRLVLFLDYGADESSVPYILDEFSYFFETPYDVTDPTFSDCSVNRPPNSSPDGKMYIVNHFLDEKVLGSNSVLIPDNSADGQTNAQTGVGSIGAQVNLCEGLYGRAPNVVLLDFFNRPGGSWMGAQAKMNEM